MVSSRSSDLHYFVLKYCVDLLEIECRNTN
nr:MAG TPA: hypothetical protein [Caudoviricetes sp.]